MLKDTTEREVFDSLVQILPGDGQSTLFWRDRWIGGRSAVNFAPGLTATVGTRARNTRTVHQGLQNNNLAAGHPGHDGIPGRARMSEPLAGRAGSAEERGRA